MFNRNELQNEINDKNCFVFRKGMYLTKEIFYILFNKDIVTPENYPQYVIDGPNFSLVGTDHSKSLEFDYMPLVFTFLDNKVLNRYPTLNYIPYKEIKTLSDTELRIAFFSGYLKRNTRGYYFTKNKKALTLYNIYAIL